MKFYGVMIDESTNLTVTNHLVMFATFVEETLMCTFRPLTY